MSTFSVFKDEDFEDLIKLVESDGDDWELMNDGSSAEGVKVWRRPDKKNKALIVLRASITVKELDPLDVMSVWRDIDYRFSWDDRCAKNVCHSKIGEGDTENEIGYYEGKAPPPLSNRDFVLQSGWRYEFKGKQQWLVMNKSIQHDEFPEQKGIVRGVSFITGTRIVKADDGSVTITYVTNGDVGGWIPKPVTNWVVTKAAPGLMTQMVKAARDYKAWLAKKA